VWARARQQVTREQVKSQGCVSRGSSTRESENPMVRGGVSIADQSGYSSTHYKFPASFFVTHEISSPSSSSRRQFCSPREFTFRLFFSTTKACPDSLNLPNAGDSFAGISLLSFLFSIFPNQGLDCYVLESSRVFFVKFPKLSLFQISELLHFIDFHRKFVKIQNQFCLKP
jgi:hypothetical protein